MDIAPENEQELLRLAAAGDGVAWQKLLPIYHGRLRRMVMLRLDQHLQARIDPSDVLQDVYIQASERLHEYLEKPELPFFLWLRFLAADRINRLHRYHLQTQARDAAREVSLFDGNLPEASSAALATQLLGAEQAPQEAAIRAEQIAFVQLAINQLDPLDKEVLALRHFEHLTSPETADVLGITVAAAAKRYFRALQRLKESLKTLPGGLDFFSHD
jgi:RNA polymerase sigma-70 factor, ECF subfamily